jgi:hypothetical protein
MRVRCLLATVTAVLAVGAGSTSAAAAPAYDYPAAFERAFLSSCNAASGGMSGPCRCALRWIERHYSYKQFVSIYLNSPQRMRKIMLRAVNACR